VQRVFEQDGWIELDDTLETGVVIEDPGIPVEADFWLLTGGLVWGAETAELGGGAALEVGGGGGGAFEVAGGGA
jgi:hypothetical protein